MGYADGRAHVSGHIGHYPLWQSNDTLSDHWLQIVVFYTLYLMVPLLKRHFHLAWHDFTTESVYMRGTNLQSHGQCIYKASCVLIRLSGGRGSRRLSWVPTLHLGGWEQGVEMVVLWVPNLPISERWPPGHPHWDAHFPLDFPKGLVVDPWGCIKFPERDLSAEVLHELSELIIPDVCLQLMQGPPTQVKVTRG